MAKKTYAVRFTASELDLLYREFNASLDNGAEDADFTTIRDKALAVLRKAIADERAPEQRKIC